MRKYALRIRTQSGAIAAGNAVVVKCSEFSRATSSLLAELLPKYLDPSLYAIVNGGVAEATKVCDSIFSHSSLCKRLLASRSQMGP